MNYFKKNESDKLNNFYKIILRISIIITLIIISYGIISSLIWEIDIVGDTLVNINGKPFEIPSPEILPIYAKPITWMYVFVLIGWFSFLEINKEKFKKISAFKLGILKMLAFLIASISIYEVFYNFSTWSALMSQQATMGIINPDSLVNQAPNPEYTWNLTFATKFFTILTIIGMYSLQYIHRMEKN